MHKTIATFLLSEIKTGELFYATGGGYDLGLSGKFNAISKSLCLKLYKETVPAFANFFVCYWFDSKKLISIGGWQKVELLNPPSV